MTTTRLRQMKQKGEKISMLTSYDFTLASLVDEAGIDMFLVGDSASNIVCGNAYTLPITLDEMIFLSKGVVRASQHALVVSDMPFGSYQVSEEDAVRNAIRMMKESGCDALSWKEERKFFLQLNILFKRVFLSWVTWALPLNL
jgi:3-methyl-2-oxobutanoate hydroxymethyltransferase